MKIIQYMVVQAQYNVQFYPVQKVPSKNKLQCKSMTILILEVGDYITFAEASQAPDTNVLKSGPKNKLITSPV